MTHQEYIEKIARQRSIINRLFKCRENRSKMIQKITEERYADLIGKFFKADDRLKSAMKGGYYYIVGVSTCSNYISSNQVIVELICRTFGTTQQLCDSSTKVIGVDFGINTFRFEPSDDIVKFIEPMLVSKEEAMNCFDDLMNQMTENFLMLN